MLIFLIYLNYLTLVNNSQFITGLNQPLLFNLRKKQ